MIAQPAFSVLEDLEFAPPCSNSYAAGQPCERSAEWAISATHTRMTCPATGFVCSPCKDALVAGWSAQLANGAPPCLRCGNIVTGLVSDNLHFIPL